jgi:light-independent protochlorophyllide reductase subunit B
MKLAYWMYAGPAHIGTLRIATSFKNVHAIMHAPLGDDYFNVMQSMLERKRDFTPVTASIVDRHVLARGSQEKVINNIRRKDLEEQPELVILTPTCTSSILQEDLQNFVNRASLETKAEVLLADVNHYRVNEMQAADRTLQQIVEFYLNKERKQKNLKIKKTSEPSVNIIGSYNLAFHNQHDITELKHLFSDLGIKINAIIPEGTSVHELKNLPKAWFNFVPYREIGLLTAEFLKKDFDMPYIDITPIGVIEIAKFIRSIQQLLNDQNYNVNFEEYINIQTRFVSQSAWFSRSIDCQALTGKKAFVFGDSTHAAKITKILTKEMGVRVVLAGTYCKYDKSWFKKEIGHLCDQILLTDDHKLISDLITKLQPNAIFGTQMERHIAKRLNIPCGVISAPVHIQNFPLSYRPFCGYEGANQIADLIYNSFTLGMEDHLLEIFGGHDTKEIINTEISNSNPKDLSWSDEAQEELLKIPRFVRNKIKQNTENFVRNKNLSVVTLQLMYDAKQQLS